MSICNNRQHWNSDKCRYECKELIDKDRCNDGFIWHSSIFEYECEKSCDVGEYLDYPNCKCRKRLIVKLVLECEDDILNVIPLNTVDTIWITDKNVTCTNNCLIYIILLTIMCLILLAIVSICCCYY